MIFDHSLATRIGLRHLTTGARISLCLLLTIPLGGILVAVAQSPGATHARGRFRKVEPNLYAPELYNKQLKAVFCLVNLPGADSRASYMEMSYEVYFVGEGAFNDTMKKVLDEGGQLTRATQFAGRILLGEGRFKLKRLATPGERTRTEGPMEFKSKVPDGLRTKFATVLISFAVKIYDGKLKTPFFRSSFFITHPFDDNPAHPERAIPRDALQINFFITDKGDLFASQGERRPGDTTWP